MPECLPISPAEACRWDLVALGEVMLRLDPGEGRIATARSFTVWEGGGEYNVARGLRRCFGRRTTIVTALADNAVGRLIEDLILQGGVDTSHIRWMPYDGVGRTVRNGLNFTERGFGVRGAHGCSDRGHSAASQLRAGSIDWDALFAAEPPRWLHCGGIFAGLSASVPDVVETAMRAARSAGAIVSYDLNYRPSLWQEAGGRHTAAEVNRELLRHVDVLFANEDAIRDGLDLELDPDARERDRLDPARYADLLAEVDETFPAVRVVALSQRIMHSTTVNDWGAIAHADGELAVAPPLPGVEILDRIGGGDAFAAGVIEGLLDGAPLEHALALGVAHGALAMTTPGDSSMATRSEVERLAAGHPVTVVR